MVAPTEYRLRTYVYLFTQLLLAPTKFVPEPHPPQRAPSNFLRGPGFPAANSGGGSREGKEGVWVDELCAAGGG